MSDKCVVCYEVSAGKPLYKKLGSNNHEVDVISALRALELVNDLTEEDSVTHYICWDCDETIADAYSQKLEEDKVASKAAKKKIKKDVAAMELTKQKLKESFKQQKSSKENAKKEEQRYFASHCLLCSCPFDNDKGFIRFNLSKKINNGCNVAKMLTDMNLSSAVDASLLSKRYICSGCFHRTRRSYRAFLQGDTSVVAKTLPQKPHSVEEHAAEIAKLLPPSLASSYKILGREDSPQPPSRVSSAPSKSPKGGYGLNVHSPRRCKRTPKKKGTRSISPLIDQMINGGSGVLLTTLNNNNNNNNNKLQKKKKSANSPSKRLKTIVPGSKNKFSPSVNHKKIRSRSRSSSGSRSRSSSSSSSSSSSNSSSSSSRSSSQQSNMSSSDSSSSSSSSSSGSSSESSDEETNSSVPSEKNTLKRKKSPEKSGEEQANKKQATVANLSEEKRNNIAFKEVGSCTVCGMEFRNKPQDWWYHLHSEVENIPGVSVMIALQYLDTSAAKLPPDRSLEKLVCTHCYKRVAAGFRSQILNKVAASRGISVGDIDMSKFKVTILDDNKKSGTSPPKKQSKLSNGHHVNKSSLKSPFPNKEASPRKSKRHDLPKDFPKDLPKASLFRNSFRRQEDNHEGQGRPSRRAANKNPPVKGNSSLREKYVRYLNAPARANVNKSSKNKAPKMSSKKGTYREDDDEDYIPTKKFEPLLPPKGLLKERLPNHRIVSNKLSIADLKKIHRIRKEIKVSVKDIGTKVHPDCFAGLGVVSHCWTRLARKCCAMCCSSVLPGKAQGGRNSSFSESTSVQPPNILISYKWARLSLGKSVSLLSNILCSSCASEIKTNFITFIRNKVAQSQGIQADQFELSGYVISFNEEAMNIVADPIEDLDKSSLNNSLNSPNKSKSAAPQNSPLKTASTPPVDSVKEQPSVSSEDKKCDDTSQNASPNPCREKKDEKTDIKMSADVDRGKSKKPVEISKKQDTLEDSETLEDSASLLKEGPKNSMTTPSPVKKSLDQDPQRSGSRDIRIDETESGENSGPPVKTDSEASNEKSLSSKDNASSEENHPPVEPDKVKDDKISSSAHESNEVGITSKQPPEILSESIPDVLNKAEKRKLTEEVPLCSKARKCEKKSSDGIEIENRVKTPFEVPSKDICFETSEQMLIPSNFCIKNVQKYLNHSEYLRLIWDFVSLDALLSPSPVLSSPLQSRHVTEGLVVLLETFRLHLGHQSSVVSEWIEKLVGKTPLDGHLKNLIVKLGNEPFSDLLDSLNENCPTIWPVIDLEQNLIAIDLDLPFSWYSYLRDIDIDGLMAGKVHPKLTNEMFNNGLLYGLWKSCEVLNLGKGTLCRWLKMLSPYPLSEDILNKLVTAAEFIHKHLQLIPGHIKQLEVPIFSVGCKNPTTPNIENSEVGNRSIEGSNQLAIKQSISNTQSSMHKIATSSNNNASLPPQNNKTQSVIIDPIDSPPTVSYASDNKINRYPVEIGQPSKYLTTQPNPSVPPSKKFIPYIRPHINNPVSILRVNPTNNTGSLIVRPIFPRNIERSRSLQLKSPKSRNSTEYSEHLNKLLKTNSLTISSEVNSGEILGLPDSCSRLEQEDAIQPSEVSVVPLSSSSSANTSDEVLFLPNHFNLNSSSNNLCNNIAVFNSNSSRLANLLRRGSLTLSHSPNGFGS